MLFSCYNNTEWLIRIPHFLYTHVISNSYSFIISDSSS